MGARHPEVIATFLKAHARDRLMYRGAIEQYDNDEHEVTFGWRAAAEHLAGEDAYDDEVNVAIGFANEDAPLFVNVEKTTLPVFTILDGESVRVSASWAAFVKKLGAAEAPEKKPSSKTTPYAIVPGPETVAWPDDPVVSVRVGQATDRKDFLWFDKVTPKSNQEALLRYVRPQGFRSTFAVGAKWDAKAATKLDRGTGKIIDFAAFDSRTPVVTPRAAELLKSIQPKTLEFLPVRAEVGKTKLELFIMNVTLAVPCVDAKRTYIPSPPSVFPYRMQTPSAIDDGHATSRPALRLDPERIPTDPVFFRPAEYPEAILATRAMVERLRGARFSGLSFVSMEQHEFK